MTVAHVPPRTWAFKFKCFTDGIIRKFKARFCARGDSKVEEVYYFEKYALVVYWTTVRLILILSINQGWSTEQVDFSNYFVHSTFVEDVFLTLPSYFDSNTGEYIANMVMKLNNSLGGMVQASLYWYNHLKGNFDERGFKPSHLDNCMFYGRGIIALLYVYGELIFGPDQYNIDEFIK